ncbi:hypothetical protein ALT761_02569 [Alteromonas sp. 76-1]|jgi:hypothetical protein|uniref:hypothetical protein n=1 Tax=Alteromonas sp. 76-1 TaxID=2358187 RepID=UPI000FD16032|nr:hypothetical protein [Alteromonas sp. 76-1]VEL97565.1 hypothetical protein ALT761_02569 [Alteromonas sp. 76-1]
MTYNGSNSPNKRYLSAVTSRTTEDNSKNFRCDNSQVFKEYPDREKLRRLIKDFQSFQHKTPPERIEIAGKIKYLLNVGSVGSFLSVTSNDKLIKDAEAIVEEFNVQRWQPKTSNCGRCNGFGMPQHSHVLNGRCFNCGTLPRDMQFLDSEAANHKVGTTL